MLEVSKKPHKDVNEEQRNKTLFKVGFSLRKGNKKDKLYVVKNKK